MILFNRHTTHKFSKGYWLLIAVTFLLALNNNLNAQSGKTRILFVLDGSGSMAGQWGGKSKFAIARELLFHSIDSLERNSENVEFGLRIFGHQSHKDLKDCEDSKLEVDFGSSNAGKIKDVLKNVSNRGHTPIAYSLFQAANDFPPSKTSRNIIILITDGIETCEGDPCAVTGILQKKRIFLRPFIIGLGMGEDGSQYFDCVGDYYDAGNTTTFRNALNIVISQAMNATTAQINLIDAYGNPTETDLEITLYDAFSGVPRYQFVHAIGYYNAIDTLYLNPAGKYNMVVHSIPPVERKNIELTPGKHNIIACDVPQGSLVLKIDGNLSFSDIPCLVRKAGDSEILHVMQMNTRSNLLIGQYDLELLTLPRQYISNVQIDQSKETEIVIPTTGSLNIITSRPGIASIYELNEGTVNMIYENENLVDKDRVKLQPGEYMIVYRQDIYKSAELTQTKLFNIVPKGVYNVSF